MKAGPITVEFLGEHPVPPKFDNTLESATLLEHLIEASSWAAGDRAVRRDQEQAWIAYFEECKAEVLRRMK